MGRRDSPTATPGGPLRSLLYAHSWNGTRLLEPALVEMAPPLPQPLPWKKMMVAEAEPGCPVRVIIARSARPRGLTRDEGRGIDTWDFASGSVYTPPAGGRGEGGGGATWGAWLWGEAKAKAGSGLCSLSEVRPFLRSLSL